MLKTTWEQLRDLYFGMTFGTRVVAGLLALVLIVCFGYLIFPSAMGGGKAKEILLFNGYEFSGSEQRVAAEALSNEGLKDYTWDNGNRLKVPTKMAEVYTAALSKGNAVPKDATMLLIESMNSSTPFDTKALFEGKQRMAMSAATSQVLRKMGGLDNVEVFLDQDKNFKDLRNVRTRTVAVAVWPQPNKELTPEILGGIAGTVKYAFGISNISDVFIVDMRNGNGWKGTEDWFQGGANSYSDNKRKFEIQWEKLIHDHFYDIEGLCVATSVSLEQYISLGKYEIQHQKPIITYSDDFERKAEGKGGNTGGRPGLEMQGSVPEGINVPLPLNNGRMASSSEYKQSESRNRNAPVAQGTEIEAQYLPLPPKSVSASLRVPYSYFKRTWIQSQKENGVENPESNAAQLDTWIAAQITRMKEQVVTLLKQGNVNLDEAEVAKQVTIETYHMQVEEPPVLLSKSQNILLWFAQSWQTLGLFIVVAAALGILWGMMRPAKPEPIIIYEAPEIPRSESVFETEGEEEEIALSRTLEPFDKAMRSLQEEVSELVSENPDAAANVLRQWIGKVALQER